MNVERFTEQVTDTLLRLGGPWADWEIEPASKPYFGLPAVEIRFKELIGVVAVVAEALHQGQGFNVENPEPGLLWVAPAEVRVLEVPSSTGTGSYNVRVENNQVVFCGCKGYAFGLHCRHAVSVTAEMRNHQEQLED
jgi:hypothetical protein